VGKLDKYARQSKLKEQSKVLPIRLPESIYEQFRERCEELGLSMSEAGYLLIREELEENLYTRLQTKLLQLQDEYKNLYKMRIHRI